MKDQKRFPSPIYKETVLEPNFEAVKTHYYAELMAVNYAHAVMLMDRQIISKEEGRQIICALQEVERELVPEALEYGEDCEDLFFYIERRLIDKVGIDIAGKLHTGRSRNDINITLFKMKTKQHLRSVIGDVLELRQTLLYLAEDNKETLVIAYTHGQPAQPTTFGHYLGALIEILDRDLRRLLNAYNTTDLCSMGAAAITTSGFPLDRAQVADLLGFAQPQENSYGCIAAVDYILEVYSALKILFINLGRFAQDLGFWTSFEVGQLYVPDDFVQISSIMPQKRNPVAVEHIRIQASIVLGLCDTMINAMHNTPFTDMNDAEEPIQIVGIEACQRAKRCLKLITGFVAGLKVDETRVRENMERSFVTVTELADSLVRREGISFRAAHEIASRLVRDLLSAQKGLGAMDYQSFQGFFQQITGKQALLTDAELRVMLTPDNFVKIRNCPGGPAPSVLEKSLEKYKRGQKEFQQKLEQLIAREQQAKAKLQAELRRVMET